MKRKATHHLPSKGSRRVNASKQSVVKGEKGAAGASSISKTVPESTSPNRHLSMADYSPHLLRFLNEDRTRQKFCDVTVSVGERQYGAHKVVLAHGSSYFHAELSKNPGAGTVTLDHVDDSVFRHLLGFLYTSECVVAEAELPALTEAARFLDMMDVLKLLCEEGEARPARAAQASADAAERVACSPRSRRRGTGEAQQNRVARRRSGLQPGKAAEGQGPGTTRKSARRRSAPAKYKAEGVGRGANTSRQRRGDEEQDGEEGADMVATEQNPKSDLTSTPNPVQVEDEGEEEEEEEKEEEEEEEEERNACKDVKIAGVKSGCEQSSDGDAEKQQVRPEEEDEDDEEQEEVQAPTAEGSNPTPVYPEGLAPVIIQTSSKKTLKCPKCDKTFDRTGKYESHTRVHTGEKPFQCDICQQRYSTKSNLTVHRKKHTSDTPFQKKEHKCPFCHKLHASRKTLAQHVRRFHPDYIQDFLAMRKKKSDGWKCAVCLKTFTRRPHLEEHMILHTQNRPFKCTFCDEYFKSRFARLKHQEKHHLGPFPCEICGRQFNDTGNRKRHIECTHGGKRKWTCFVCGKSVRERTTLNEHMRIHSGEKPHCCSICGQSFRHGSSYRLHLRVHYDDKRYECDKCGKTFIRHDHLTKHQKIHSGEKAHQCEECGKCFRRQDHLTVHYKSVHLGEKVWQKYKTAVHQCEVCKKEFKGKSSLEMHFRTHSGEKPYRCPVCQQTFRIKKTLSKHMVIHSDDRPFHCSHCSATFKRKDKLKYHVDHVHGAKLGAPDGPGEPAAPPAYGDASKEYRAEPKAALQGATAPTNVCVPVAIVPVQMAGTVSAGPGELSAPSQHGVLTVLAQGHQQQHHHEQHQASGFQATADLTFLEKYTLTPQPANMVHPVRPDQILDPREQSYLGTLLGLDPTSSSVQNISNSGHAH